MGSFQYVGLRRRLCGVLLGTLGTLGLSACGFAPRQAPDLPFKALAFSGFAVQAPMASELRLLINTSRSTLVIADLAQADAIFDVLADTFERTKGAFTLAGQIRSINLTYRFKFRLRTLTGVELIGPTELVVVRSLAYNESQALGKEKEEVSMVRSMQVEIANQVMRRLVAVKMP